MTHHSSDSDSGGVTTILPIVFSALLCRDHTQVVVCPGTPKVESQNCPGFGLSGLWDIIVFCPNLRSRRGLNQTCSPLWELSHVVSHSPSAHRERVGSWLLVIGSQTASLTPAPSFAHNLGCRCPNDQCEAISDIYKTFPMTPRTPQGEVFCPLLSNSKHLGVPKDSKSPTLGVWVSSSHLAKVGLRQKCCEPGSTLQLLLLPLSSSLDL
jgi:hypothetical protein